MLIQTFKSTDSYWQRVSLLIRKVPKFFVLSTEFLICNSHKRKWGCKYSISNMYVFSTSISQNQHMPLMDHCSQARVDSASSIDADNTDPPVDHQEKSQFHHWTPGMQPPPCKTVKR